MSALDERWVVLLRVDDHSGTLTALAERFSSRGVSFESFNTLTVSDGAATISIVFRGSERIARVLVHTLERLAVVRSVALRRAEDPRVRAVALLDVPEGVELALGADVVARWGAGSVVVAGSLVEVERALDLARSAGAAVAAVTVA